MTDDMDENKRRIAYLEDQADRRTERILKLEKGLRQTKALRLDQENEDKRRIAYLEDRVDRRTERILKLEEELRQKQERIEELERSSSDRPR